MGQKVFVIFSLVMEHLTRAVKQAVIFLVSTVLLEPVYRTFPNEVFAAGLFGSLSLYLTDSDLSMIPVAGLCRHLLNGASWGSVASSLNISGIIFFFIVGLTLPKRWNVKLHAVKNIQVAGWILALVVPDFASFWFIYEPVVFLPFLCFITWTTWNDVVTHPSEEMFLFVSFLHVFVRMVILINRI